MLSGAKHLARRSSETLRSLALAFPPGQVSLRVTIQKAQFVTVLSIVIGR